MNEDLLRVSDGKLYDKNDMVRTGCHDCTGCFSCCADMGQSVLLDPYDIWMLTTNLGKSFEELLAASIELHQEAGLVLPNLRMQPISAVSEEERCVFLDGNGRCGIHGFRPGICRLFPLGRLFEGDAIRYFLLRDVCPAQNKTKVKVEKWLAIPNLKAYQAYSVRWHRLTKHVRTQVTECMQDGQEAKAVTIDFLQQFYVEPYPCEAFYGEIARRMAQWEERYHVPKEAGGVPQGGDRS